MTVYKCPACTERSVMWDPRCARFLCCSVKCGLSIDVTQMEFGSEEDVSMLITLNRVVVLGSALQIAYQRTNPAGARSA